MMRYSLTALDSNKPISLRIAHFAQFRAGKLTNFRVLVDTFDLVEQAVGYPIHLPRMAVYRRSIPFRHGRASRGPTSSSPAPGRRGCDNSVKTRFALYRAAKLRSALWPGHDGVRGRANAPSP